MEDSIELSYDRLPAVMPSYVRAALSFSKRMGKGDTIPSMTARVSGLAVDRARLARYREVCVFPSTDALPVTYPHVLAFPLHMAAMTHERFPLKLPGLVHVRNTITRHRAIANDEVLDLTVHVDAQRAVSRGIEFDLETQFSDAAGHAVWTEVGTMLSLRGQRPKSTDSRKEECFHGEHCVQWDIGSDIGRRYAFAAGDYNPIHLGACSARLFGFRRAIATGMWLKARLAAELAPHLSTPAYALSVAFKKPVFLPGLVCFTYTLNDKGALFALTDPDGKLMHLQGDVSYL